MFAIAATIAALLASLVALLAVPVALVIDARRGDTMEARWHIRWFFGLVDVRISRGRSTDAPRDDPSTRSPRKQRGSGRRVLLAVVRTRGLLHRVGRLLTAAIRRMTFDRFHLEMIFGLDNPADTGFVYGCLSPLLVMAGIRGLDVHCHPTFLDPGLRGVFQATIRLRPLLIAGTLVAFLLSPPVLRAAAAGWRARR